MSPSPYRGVPDLQGFHVHLHRHRRPARYSAVEGVRRHGVRLRRVALHGLRRQGVHKSPRGLRLMCGQGGRRQLHRSGRHAGSPRAVHGVRRVRLQRLAGPHVGIQAPHLLQRGLPATARLAQLARLLHQVGLVAVRLPLALLRRGRWRRRTHARLQDGHVHHLLVPGDLPLDTRPLRDVSREGCLLRRLHRGSRHLDLHRHLSCL
mmetsp:Transcript_33408/g.99524  ORF Transcript_33408/g.99524 Transcript_33408/m.99524 type:complete len:206 (+) Transcript_33408:541-1158(+)